MKTETINTIMTYVVRMQEPVNLFMPDGTLRNIRWVNEYAEPQIFYPAIDENCPVEAGIVGCIAFLREVPVEGTTYQVEPGGLRATPSRRIQAGEKLDILP